MAAVGGRKQQQAKKKELGVKQGSVVSTGIKSTKLGQSKTGITSTYTSTSRKRQPSMPMQKQSAKKKVRVAVTHGSDG